MRARARGRKNSPSRVNAYVLSRNTPYSVRISRWMRIMRTTERPKCARAFPEFPVSRTCIAWDAHNARTYTRGRFSAKVFGNRQAEKSSRPEIWENPPPVSTGIGQKFHPEIRIRTPNSKWRARVAPKNARKGPKFAPGAILRGRVVYWYHSIPKNGLQGKICAIFRIYAGKKSRPILQTNEKLRVFREYGEASAR